MMALLGKVTLLLDIESSILIMTVLCSVSSGLLNLKSLDIKLFKLFVFLKKITSTLEVIFSFNHD